MNYMLCKHKQGKMKLKAMAIDCKNMHKQWFEYVYCCVLCGKGIKVDLT